MIYPREGFKQNPYVNAYRGSPSGAEQETPDELFSPVKRRRVTWHMAWLCLGSGGFSLASVMSVPFFAVDSAWGVALVTVAALCGVIVYGTGSEVIAVFNQERRAAHQNLWALQRLVETRAEGVRQTDGDRGYSRRPSLSPRTAKVFAHSRAPEGKAS